MDWRIDEVLEFRLEDSLLYQVARSSELFTKQLSQHFEMIPMKMCMMHIERSLITRLVYSFRA